MSLSAASPNFILSIPIEPKPLASFASRSASSIVLAVKTVDLTFPLVSTEVAVTLNLGPASNCSLAFCNLFLSSSTVFTASSANLSPSLCIATTCPALSFSCLFWILAATTPAAPLLNFSAIVTILISFF